MEMRGKRVVLGMFSKMRILCGIFLKRLGTGELDLSLCDRDDWRGYCRVAVCVGWMK